MKRLIILLAAAAVAAVPAALGLMGNQSFATSLPVRSVSPAPSTPSVHPTGSAKQDDRGDGRRENSTASSTGSSRPTSSRGRLRSTDNARRGPAVAGNVHRGPSPSRTSGPVGNRGGDPAQRPAGSTTSGTSGTSGGSADSASSEPSASASSNSGPQASASSAGVADASGSGGRGGGSKTSSSTGGSGGSGGGGGGATTDSSTSDGAAHP